MAHERDAHGRAQPPPGHDAPAELTDATPEFEEYTAPPRLDEHGRPIPKAKGLRAQGYDFPPKDGMPQPPLTKANLAKGIGVPEVPRASPAASPKSAWPLPPLPGTAASPAAVAPPVVKVDRPERAPPPAAAQAIKVTEDPLFEEYQRPGLKEHPRTGKGIRSEPPPQPKAHEILSRIKEPEIEVATPKRFGVMPMRDVPAPPPAPKPKVDDKVAAEKAAVAAAHDAAVADQAVLDAAADLASAPDLVMSQSSAYGPLKTVVEHPADEDLFAPHPEIPPAAPGDSPLPSTTPDTPLAAAAFAAVGASTRIPEVPRQPAAVVLPPAPIPRRPVAPEPTPEVPMPPMPQHAASVSAQPHTSGAPPVKPGGAAPRIAILQSDYHFDVTTRMAESAKARATSLGATIAGHHHVPGVFDVPLAAKLILRSPDVDALVVVGAVVQGETGHDVLIARETARKLSDLAYDLEKPIGLGITGPGMTEQQAQARINSGAHAVDSVVQQHRLLMGLRA